MSIEVVHARAGCQRVLHLDVPRGSTVAEVLSDSRVKEAFADLRLDDRPVGIFGERCRPERTMAAGDRLEIYSPLRADPKVLRRRRAARAGRG